ncbi:hypothetical protein CRYUN_Cryun14cG0139100 [Craigia yunnanensis]
MLIIVTMNDHKSQFKALKIAAGVSGTESISLKGDDKSQLEVIGDGVDAIQFKATRYGYAEIICKLLAELNWISLVY